MKTTFAFEPSADSSDDGRYITRTVINGVHSEDRHIHWDSREVTVDADEGDEVRVYIAYQDGKGRTSPRRYFDFVVRDHALPATPGELRMVRVTRTVSLPVMS